MNESLASVFERLADKESSQKLLHRLGLDGRQFVIFIRLLRALSEREEFMGILGVDRFSLSFLALYAAAIGTLFCSIFAFVGIPAGLLLPANLLLVFILMLSLIAHEAANSLFNPVDASMLAHYPVHSLTYAAAKIAHIIIAVLYLVPALCMPLAFIGVMMDGTRWFWPITFLIAAFLIGLWTAFMVCAAYGWMMRFLPANWLKAISIWIQLLPLIVIPVSLIYSPKLFLGILVSKLDTNHWTWLPLMWFLEIALLGLKGAVWRMEWQGILSIVASIFVIGFGIRSFSGKYFSEGASIAQGRSWHHTRQTAFSRIGAAAIRILTGSPIGSAAYYFVSKMMRRDWQFRRNILMQTWFPLLFLCLMIAGVVRFGLPASPLAQSMPIFNDYLPHLLGLITFALCGVLSFTEFSRGSWIYLVEPIGDLRAFARGVYWALWVFVAGLPHLILLPFLVRCWGWTEAALGGGFSLLVVSLYLSFGIQHISGLPFSSHFNEPHRALITVQVRMGSVGAIIIPAGVQWALFQHWWLALFSSIILAVTTWFVLSHSLDDLEGEIRWRLHMLKMGTNQMFKEIE